MGRRSWRTLAVGTSAYLAMSTVRYTPLVSMTPRMRVVTVLLDATVALVFLMALWRSRIVQANVGRWGGWVRVFGYGVSLRRVAQHPLLFSERMGFTRYWHVGGWVARGLKPVWRDRGPSLPGQEAECVEEARTLWCQCGHAGVDHQGDLGILVEHLQGWACRRCGCQRFVHREGD